MRTIAVACGILAILVTIPPDAAGNIKAVRTRIAEVHKPGSDKGGKLGAVTLAWGNEGEKPELRTVFLVGHTKLTAVGDKGRAAIEFKDLKVDMTVVTVMSANRVGDTSWKLDELHVLQPEKPADNALVKQLAPVSSTLEGSVVQVRPPAADRKSDLGRLEVKGEQETFHFHVTADAKVVRQSVDGKQQPAKFSDLKPGMKVHVLYPSQLATQKPSEAPTAWVTITEAPK